MTVTSGGEAHGALDQATDSVEQPPAAGHNDLWVGQHSQDDDLLILDPGQQSASSDMVTLYSLSQHRTRSFPRAVVRERIRAVTDDEVLTRAKRDYLERVSLRGEFERSQASQLELRRAKQRDEVLASHRRYIETLGREYVGAQEPPGDHRQPRRTICAECGIALDNFFDAICLGCKGYLCSCGACSCGGGRKKRPVDAQE